METMTKQTQHTPGEWHARKGYVYRGDLVVCRVSVQAAHHVPSVVEANARLISAAPDGYMLARAVSNGMIDTETLRKMARDFLAKARA